MFYARQGQEDATGSIRYRDAKANMLISWIDGIMFVCIPGRGSDRFHLSSMHGMFDEAGFLLTVGYRSTVSNMSKI